MAVRARWDKYEAAVLLDAYVKTVDEIITRSAAIEKVSMMLRKRALLAGETIDSSYRNTSGIIWRDAICNDVREKGHTPTLSPFPRNSRFI